MTSEMIDAKEKYGEYPIYITDRHFQILRKNTSADAMFPCIAVGENLLYYFRPSSKEAMRNFLKNGIPAAVTLTDRASNAYSAMLYEADIKASTLSVCIAATADTDSAFPFFARARLDTIHQTVAELRKIVTTSRRKNTLAKADRRMDALLSYIYRIESVMLPLLQFDHTDYNRTHGFALADLLRDVAKRFTSEAEGLDAKITVVEENRSVCCEANGDYLFLLLSTLYYIMMCFSSNRSVTAAVSEEDDFAVLTFSLGCSMRGMKPAKEIYSFEPLYQMNTAALFDLFFAKKIVELNGWKINYSFVKSRHAFTLKVFIPRSDRTTLAGTEFASVSSRFAVVLPLMAKELLSGELLVL